MGQKLRQERLQQKVTLKDLSGKTGFSIGYISQVERGITAPSLSSLEKIAKVLGVSLGGLFHTEESQERVVRVSDLVPFSFGQGALKYNRLSHLQEGSPFESFLVEVEASYFPSETPFAHPGEEFIYVLEGAIVLDVQDGTVSLEKGDSYHFVSSQEHTWSNPYAKPSRLLWVVSPKIFHF